MHPQTSFLASCHLLAVVIDTRVVALLVQWSHFSCSPSQKDLELAGLASYNLHQYKAFNIVRQFLCFWNVVGVYSL